MLTYRVRIKELVEANGSTLYRLTRASNLLPATVYKIARGEAQPNLATLARLHEALEKILGREVAIEEIIQVVRE